MTSRVGDYLLFDTLGQGSFAKYVGERTGGGWGRGRRGAVRLVRAQVGRRWRHVEMGGGGGGGRKEGGARVRLCVVGFRFFLVGGGPRRLVAGVVPVRAIGGIRLTMGVGRRAFGVCVCVGALLWMLFLLPVGRVWWVPRYAG